MPQVNLPFRIGLNTYLSFLSRPGLYYDDLSTGKLAYVFSFQFFLVGLYNYSQSNNIELHTKALQCCKHIIPYFVSFCLHAWMAFLSFAVYTHLLVDLLHLIVQQFLQPRMV